MAIAYGVDPPRARHAPFSARTEVFALPNPWGATIRGAVHRPAAARVADREPVVLAVAGLGQPMRRTLSPALYLLANGFTVVRFDPTNGVGTSDGDMAAFTPGGLTDDIHAVARWAAERYAPCRLGYFGSSIAARAALRAAAETPGGFAVVGTLACVVDMRASLVRLCGGADPVAARHAPGDTVTLLGHDLRADSATQLVEQDWLTADSTVRDMRRAAPTRFVNVHGGADPIVPGEEARRAYRTVPGSRFTLVPGAAHDFELADRRVALGVLLAEYHRHLRGGPGPAAMVEPGRDDLAAQKEIEDEIHRVLSADTRADVHHMHQEKAI